MPDRWRVSMVVGGTAAIVLFRAAAPVGLPFATVAQAQPRATVRYVVVPDRSEARYGRVFFIVSVEDTVRIEADLTLRRV